jgi:hypothetical protein
LPFFFQNCSLPFSLRSLDIPALLKSWKKHYVKEGNYHRSANKTYQKDDQAQGANLSEGSGAIAPGNQPTGRVLKTALVYSGNEI